MKLLIPKFCPAERQSTGQVSILSNFLRPNRALPGEIDVPQPEPQPLGDSGKTDSSLSQTVSRIMALTIFLVTQSPTVGKDISS